MDLPVKRYWDLDEIKPDAFAISCKIQEFGGGKKPLFEQMIYSLAPEPPFHPLTGNGRAVSGGNIIKTESGTVYQISWKVEMREMMKEGEKR